MNSVMFTAPFNPPVMTTGIPAANDPANWNTRLRDILGKRRRDITDGCTGILGVKEQCTAQRDLVGHLRCPFFPIFTAGFPAECKLGTCQKTNQSIACTVQIDLTLKSDFALRAHHPPGNRGDHTFFAIPCGLNFMDIRVQIQADVGFSSDGFQNDQVPEIRIALRITILILYKQFPHDACLTGITVNPVGGSAADPYAYFTAGITAEYRTILYQRDFLAESCRSYGGAYASKPAPDDGDIRFNEFMLHTNTSLILYG